MLSTRTVVLMVLTAACFGFLAGENLDRSVVQMPAWQWLGAQAWAQYSIHADLSNGILVYPLEAIGGIIFSLFTIFSFRRESSQLNIFTTPIYLTPVLGILGLAATLLAAPNMFHVANSLTDPQTLDRLFHGFWFWGNVRGAFQIAAFWSSLWSLAAAATAVPSKPSIRAPMSGTRV